MKNILFAIAVLFCSFHCSGQVEGYIGGGVGIGFYSSAQLDDIFTYFNNSALELKDPLELPVFMKGFNLHYVYTDEFSFGYGLEFLRGTESGARTDSILETQAFDLRFTEINFQYLLGYGLLTKDDISLYAGGQFALGIQSIGQQQAYFSFENYEQIYFSGNYGAGIFVNAIVKLTDWLCVSTCPYITFYLQSDDFGSIGYDIAGYDIPSEITYQGFGVKKTIGIDIILAYGEY